MPVNDNLRTVLIHKIFETNNRIVFRCERDEKISIKINDTSHVCYFAFGLEMHKIRQMSSSKYQLNAL